MKLPKVSLLIPVFNGEKYISEALESALNQTYSNLEIIVHDDASTDKTLKILKSYKDHRLKIIHTKINHGMIGGWNFITQKASGKWIKHLAADDLLEPDCVEKLVNAAQKNPHACIITCKRKFIDYSGKLLYQLQFARKDMETSGPKLARQILLQIRENKIGEPTAVLFRKQDFLKAGMFDPAFSQFADFELWARLLEYGDLAYVNKSLCSFRVHPESNTLKAIRDGRFIDEIFLLIEKYYESPRYRKVFNLSARDRDRAIRTKVLDTLKNIKDLAAAGNFSRAVSYFNRLSKSIRLTCIAQITIRHLLK